LVKANRLSTFWKLMIGSGPIKCKLYQVPGTGQTILTIGAYATVPGTTPLSKIQLCIVAQSGTVTKNARSTFYQRHHSGNLRFFPINWQSKGKMTDAFVR
jgi:hypothetical protein